MPTDAPNTPYGASLVDPDSGEDLMTVAELSVWARQDIDPDDPFARAVIAACSLKTRDVAQQHDWDITTVPPKARMICTQLAKRTYLNPDSVVAEGGLGPIGGDRYVEEFARALEFTATEVESLLDLSPGGEQTGERLWVQSTTGGSVEMVPHTMYYQDDSNSDWEIPLVDIPATP